MLNIDLLSYMNYSSYLYDEIYWCRKYLNENSYEMMITYVYMMGEHGNIQTNINLHKLKNLLKYSLEFRHFIIAICNDFFKWHKYDYDFVFFNDDSRMIMTIIKTNDTFIKNLFLDGTHEDKQNYLINYEKWKHKIIE